MEVLDDRVHLILLCSEKPPGPLQLFDRAILRKQSSSHLKLLCLLLTFLFFAVHRRLFFLRLYRDLMLEKTCVDTDESVFDKETEQEFKMVPVLDQALVYGLYES